MSKTVYGSILDATEDIICHQVNCRGVMGAGVAKALCQR
jgi:O-acetyl-ADP-ribose deacetylase (regulator of RNase III)